MAMRLLDVAFPTASKDLVVDLLRGYPDLDVTLSACENGVYELRALAPADNIQSVVDALQSRFTSVEGWRIAILPVEAALQPETVEEETPKKKSSGVSLREEIYQDVSTGAELNSNFITLTILSAVVAAFGINTDNIAVVIGAMVIAPLLGPLLAFSFGSALGDLKLMISAGRTALVGLAIGFATASALSVVVTVNMQSGELLSRSVVGYDTIVLALASGAAAALSIVTGLSGALVGVMVAVALLPPSVAIALFLGAGEFTLAARAVFLLAINVVSINFASQFVFFAKGIRPRTWLEQRAAKQSRRLNFAVWGGSLIALALLILATSY